MLRLPFTRKTAGEPTVASSNTTTGLEGVSSPSSSTTTETTPPMRRNVSFGDRLEILEFPIVLGDSVCSSGPPVQLSWTPTKTVTRNLEMHELCREQTGGGGSRRSKKELIISEEKRAVMLRNAGYDEKEIQIATKDAKKIRQYRRENRYL